MTGEKALYDYLKQQQQQPGCPPKLLAADIHDSVYAKFAKDKPTGVRIGDGSCWPAVGVGGAVKEYDLHFVVVCYAKVQGKEFTERAAAREEAALLAHDVVAVITQDRSLNTVVCDKTDVRKLQRGFDTADNGTPYGICELAIVIDGTGRVLPSPFN